MKVIDKPKSLTLGDYKNCLNKVTTNLRSCPDILSIYQIGGITAPGISDIDMVFICKDHAKITTSFLNFLEPHERYAFVHGIYGISSKYFEQAKNFTLYHNYRHLYGEKRSFGNELLPEDKKILERQVALEFLVKIYLNLVLQLHYDTIKLRSFFLHIKGILYDLDFLDRKTTPLAEKTRKFVNIRENWFTEKISDEALTDMFKKYAKHFVEALSDIFEDETLYLPAGHRTPLGKNIDLVYSQKLGVSFKGIKLPAMFAVNKLFFKINNRLNYCTLKIPFTDVDKIDLLQKRYILFKSLEAYRVKYMPHTLSLTSSLKFF